MSDTTSTTSTPRLTVREAIFLATSGTCDKIAGYSDSPDAMTTAQVAAVVAKLDASTSRDPNLDTARAWARDALDFRTRHGY